MNKISPTWPGVIFAMLAALISFSCGNVNSTQMHSTVTPVANLTINTSAVDFGNVTVGSSKSESITLSNTGSQGAPDVTIANANVSGNAFAAQLPSMPLQLAAGQSATITVVFSPKSAGSDSGSLSIAASGAADPAAISLSGTAVGNPQLAVSPSTLNFGNVAVGSTQQLSGTLTAGNANVTVSSAAWSGSGYSVSGISFPVTIQANNSVPYTVTFTPDAAGSATGSISFVSNATNSPTVESLAGSGTQVTTAQHSVGLSWEASTSSVIGYNIYRGTQSGGPYSKLTSSPQPTSAGTDNTVQAGGTYFYVVTSVSSGGIESAFSNEVAATVPGP